MCASCNEPHMLPDGVSMSEKLHLADGQCIPCTFPHCRDCTSDGKELHCTSCEQPFLAIRSDDPAFDKSGIDKSQGQCQTCSSSCLECSERPHWCTRCDVSKGLTMVARRLVGQTTAGTCIAVHPTCATSDRPALAPGCSSGTSADDTLTAEFSCTSCREGEGLNLLPGSSRMGRCEPCDKSCTTCFLANNPSSCTSCESGGAVNIRDFGNSAGVCSASTSSSDDQCDDCVSRATANCVEPAPMFVTRVLGETADKDLGVCQEYTPDCSIQCAPAHDTGEVPARRVCSKHCLQKAVKVIGGKKHIIVCKTRKTVKCAAEASAALGESAQALSNEFSDNSLETEEISEKCQQEKEASCAAVLPFDAKHWVQDERGIIEQATVAAGFRKEFIQSAPGCELLGNVDTVLNACASTLLMF